MGFEQHGLSHVCDFAEDHERSVPHGDDGVLAKCDRLAPEQIKKKVMTSAVISSFVQLATDCKKAVLNKQFKATKKCCVIQLKPLNFDANCSITFLDFTIQVFAVSKKLSLLFHPHDRKVSSSCKAKESLPA